MFRKIVVPVDLSKRHDRALKMAAELARQSGGDVTLLHVIELLSDLPREEEPEFYARLESAATRHLAKLGARLTRAGVKWRPELLFGNRAEVIVRRAADLGADLLVLSSHRIDLEKPYAGWGTQSYKVSILAQCPVMLVK